MSVTAYNCRRQAQDTESHPAAKIAPAHRSNPGQNPVKTNQRYMRSPGKALSRLIASQPVLHTALVTESDIPQHLADISV